MHSGHSCQLHRTASVPGAARGHSGMPEMTDTHILAQQKINPCSSQETETTCHRESNAHEQDGIFDIYVIDLLEYSTKLEYAQIQKTAEIIVSITFRPRNKDYFI